MLWEQLPLGSIWRQLVSAGVCCPRNLFLYVQKGEWSDGGGRRGWLGVDMKKEFLVCFYGKASVNVSKLPAHRSGPPRLTDSSGFHQEEKTYMSAYRRTREWRPISPAEPAERQQKPGCVASDSLSQTHTCPSGLGAIKPPGPSESWLPASVHPCSSLLFQ